MFIRMVMIVALMIIGGSAPVAPAPPAPLDAVVHRQVTVATSTRTTAAADASPGVSVKQLDIVVPPVNAQGEVGATPAPTPDATSEVVADTPILRDRLASGVVDTRSYQTLGVTWPDGVVADELQPQVRTRQGGSWTDWQALQSSDQAPDPGTADAARASRSGTESLWIGDADAVQLSFAATADGSPNGLVLALVGSAVTPATGPSALGASATGDLVVRDAAYTTSVPTVSSGTRVITRAEWGAPAQVCTPDVASRLVGAVVHHTADSNAYSTVAQAMQQIRNDAAYHINVQGWCDIGYNFIVDKWGNIYEGRANSLTQPVIGVHAGGFNTGTVGVAMLGTYDAAPSAATEASVAYIIGLRLGAYGVDPRGSMSYYTGNGENSRFLNQTVTLPRVFGHRDVAYTACPGNGGYAALDAIRADAWVASQFVTPVAGTNLVRSADSPTIYLITPDHKYPIDSWSTYLSLGVLGPFGIVSQSALDAKVTGPVLGRFIRGPDATIYLFDDGIRHLVPTCDVVAAFGRSCSEYGSMTLTDEQIARFGLGTDASTTVTTTNGKAFVVTAGTRREATGPGALESVGAPAPMTLEEDAIASLAYGAPIIATDVVLRDRATGARSVYVAGAAYPVAPSLAEESALGRAFPPADLDGASLAFLPTREAITGMITGSDGGHFALTAIGKRPVAQGYPLALPVTTVPDTLLRALPDAPDTSGMLFIKGAGSPTIYLMSAGVRRPIDQMSTIRALLAPGVPFDYAVAGGAEVASLAAGAPVLPPGSVVKSASAPELYLVDGLNQRIPVPSMSMLSRYGLTWSVQPDAVLTAYAVSASPLATSVICNGVFFVMVNGALVPVGGDGLGLAYRPLGAATCSTLRTSPVSLNGIVFAKGVNSSTVYLVAAGVKRAVPSMPALYALNAGNPSVTIVTLDDDELGALASGVPLLAPGSVVKGASSPDLYLIDGTAARVKIPSMAMLRRYGLTWVLAPDTLLAAYPVTSQPLATPVRCGGQTPFVMVGGALMPVDGDGFGLSYRSLAASTCATFPRSSSSIAGRVFVKDVDSPTVYAVQNGVKQAIPSMATLYALNAGSLTLTIVTMDDAEVAALVSGPSL